MDFIYYSKNMYGTYIYHDMLQHILIFLNHNLKIDSVLNYTFMQIILATRHTSFFIIGIYA